MSGSSTASSDTSMIGQVPSEEEIIANAGSTDVLTVEHGANLNRPSTRPTDGQAVQMHTSENDPLLVSGQTISNDHPHARDRKRRLTSNSDASRLQRTRSGGAIRPDASTQAALPHRSVSMVLPSSRGSNSKAPGSSYATAIDITSSPSDDGRYGSIDPAGSGHGSSSFRAPSNWSHASDNGSHPTRIASRFQQDSRVEESRHVLLSSGASSTSRMAETPNDRPGFQTWHPASETGVQADVLMNSKNKVRQPLPWEPQSRRSSQGSSGGAWESYAQGNSHRGITGQEPRVRASSFIIGQIPWMHQDSQRIDREMSKASDGGQSAGLLMGIPQKEGSFPRAREKLLEPGPIQTKDDMGGIQNIKISRCLGGSLMQKSRLARFVAPFLVSGIGNTTVGSVAELQFIVRPPDTPSSPPSSSPPSHPPVVDLTVDDSTPVTSLNSPINPALGGGEKVRLCNPCVPDPNPNPLGYGSPRAHGHRSTHSLTSSPTSSMGNLFSRPAREEASSRQERRTVGANDRPSFLQGLGQPARRSVSGAMASFGNRSRMAGTISVADLSAAAFAPPRDTQVSEEDLCPVCTRRFPALSNEHTQDAREAHVRECIASYGASPVHREPQHVDLRQPPPPPRPSPAAARMLPFTATEKDCLAEDGSVAECTICMIEYEVGDSLARLNCFCKFHKTCIVEWFEKKPVCPTHQG
ncbi:uncharacterized protein N7473_006679 [Penicillium subrubescens]|uniref:uncharacterized protein n=1 Tax=Penicillium subrubescens TaxID=1316194 RepID=UPI002544F3A2|nr:uncharacterized protein N7473_006679 [Penicillium subrubescens]KAJ5890451.1 hypothetical protein N7473_006679 [Penicillium subrubescens]